MADLSFSVLRLKNFRLLLVGRTLATFAWHAQAVIVGWQVYSLTKSPFLLGLTGLTEALPAVVCSLFAGHFVDGGHPGRIMTASLAVLAANTMMLLLLGGGFVAPPGGNLVAWIFCGVFISGCARSFFSPSSQALVSRLVPRGDLPAAAGWVNSGFYVAATGGPAVAGLLYGGYGPSGAWALPALLALMSCALIACVRAEHRARGAEKAEPAFKSMRAGWHFILTNPALLGMMLLDFVAVLFGGATAMLPVYADQVLHIGSEGLGLLRAAPWIGAMPASLLLSLRPLKKLSTVRLLGAVSVFGLSIIGFGLSTNPVLSMLFLGLSGIASSVSYVIRGTLLQILTPEHMRGRVFSISLMFIISTNEIGAFESGTAARFLGLVPSVVAGGIMTLIVAAAVALSSPKFRKTEVEV